MLLHLIRWETDTALQIKLVLPFLILTAWNNTSPATIQTQGLKNHSIFLRQLLWNKAMEWGTDISGGKKLFFSLNWLINEIEISWSMFHSPKKRRGIRSPLHLYHRSASALTTGTWCRLITTTNRGPAAWPESGRSQWLLARDPRPLLSPVPHLPFWLLLDFYLPSLNTNSWSP